MAQTFDKICTDWWAFECDYLIGWFLGWYSHWINLLVNFQFPLAEIYSYYTLPTVISIIFGKSDRLLNQFLVWWKTWFSRPTLFRHFLACFIVRSCWKQTSRSGNCSRSSMSERIVIRLGTPIPRWCQKYWIKCLAYAMQAPS